MISFKPASLPFLLPQHSISGNNYPLDQFRVGEGAGVSPFCSVHQPMRSAIAEKITIGGKKIIVYQLGCKSGGGKKGFADKWIAAAGADKAVVDKILDNHMCCYSLKIV